jgi:lactoylglutathione lyase
MLLTAMDFLHTCRSVGDLTRSVPFYEALGFEERRRIKLATWTYVFMGLPGEGDLLELVQVDGVSGYDLGTGYRHIALGTTDIARVLAVLGERGIKADDPPRRKVAGGSLLCFVRDPDGYVVELIERPGVDQVAGRYANKDR